MVTEIMDKAVVRLSSESGRVEVHLIDISPQ